MRKLSLLPLRKWVPLLVALLYFFSVPRSEAGFVSWDYYANPGVPNVGGLLSLGRSPDQVQILTNGYLLPAGDRGTYGAIVRAYIEPPETGFYQFSILFDDL